MKSNSHLLVAFVAVFIITVVRTHAATISFRQGVGGYTQAQDTWLPKASPNTNWGTNPGIGVGRLGAANEEQALLGFYGIFGNGVGQIPLGSTINSATLSVFNSGVTIPANGAVHRMLIPWNELTETWNGLNGGLNNVPLGEYNPTPDFSGSFGAFTVTVTSLVQAWSNGATNYGLGIIPTTPTGSFSFQSAEHPNPTLRPILIVDYVAIPEPATITLLIAASVAMAGVRRRY